MDCSPPGSYVHGILQARTLEWTAMPSSMGASHAGLNQSLLSPALTRGFFTTITTWQTQKMVKVESEKAGLKLNNGKKTHGIWSHHLTANRKRKGGSSDRFYFLGSKITADGDCRHQIKRCLLPGRKAMTNLNSILKSRDSTWLTKAYTVKAMVFPVVIYRCESWTIKKAEHWRTDAF